MNIVPLADKPATDWWSKLVIVLGEAGMNVFWSVVIVVVCGLIAYALRFVIRRVVRRIVEGAKSKANVDDTQALERSPLADMRLVQRTRTLGSILQNIVNVALVVIALILVVNTFDSSLLGSLTLLTAAVGAGLGFGAQNIVKDVLNGIFLVAEDQIGIGDVVELRLSSGGATGVVEYVSVRVTQVRDVNGTLWYVRNGEVTHLGNMSQGWARAIVDLGVPADADLPAVEEAVLATAQALAKDPKWRTRIIEKPELWGLESVSGEALVVRIVIKTRANTMDDVAQELRARLRSTVLGLGLDVPHMESVTLSGPEGARRVRGANPPKTRPNPVAGVPERGFWRRKKNGGEKTPAVTTPQPAAPPKPPKPARPAKSPGTIPVIGAATTNGAQRAADPSGASEAPPSKDASDKNSSKKDPSKKDPSGEDASGKDPS
ncbi:mechanosensitive ion channel family protein [uncultured Microbacterium sp.]|uniref:mechanosensitive ion channel family protein n=1 Tax=uncultured Microbacterium sp. TaxID=191216 RepID=UPI0025DF95E9|nr:mechanosensitive ion channel domain-containing protein [uncultured Microbacterium sp.]